MVSWPLYCKHNRRRPQTFPELGNRAIVAKDHAAQARGRQALIEAIKHVETIELKLTEELEGRWATWRLRRLCMYCWMYCWLAGGSGLSHTPDLPGRHEGVETDVETTLKWDATSFNRGRAGANWRRTNML